MMPKLHNRFNDPLRLAVGLGSLDLRKPLFDPLTPAKCHKSVVFRISPILFSIIGIVLFNRIGTFFQNLLQKDLGAIVNSCVWGI